jgi:hypothetical protein
MVYPMLPVSQDCSVWCTLCCQFLRIVVYGVPYVASFSGLWCMVYPMLPVSQDCSVWCTLCCQFLRIVVYGVPYVASFSGSSIFNYPTILSNVYLMCLPPIILICPYLSDKQLLYKRETTLSMKNRIFLFFCLPKLQLHFNSCLLSSKYDLI